MATVNKKPSWSVRHYQVNGAADGQGEAAIYLLVDGNQDSNIRTNKTDPRPEIMFALLIDGGYGPIMLQNLTELMTQRIPLEYCGDSVAAVGKTIKFDAVVITHWDQVGISTGFMAVPSPDICRLIGGFIFAGPL